MMEMQTESMENRFLNSIELGEKERIFFQHLCPWLSGETIALWALVSRERGRLGDKNTWREKKLRHSSIKMYELLLGFSLANNRGRESANWGLVETFSSIFGRIKRNAGNV